MKSKYEKLLLTNRKQEFEIISLKEQSIVLENKQIKDTEKLNVVEQYGRRQNLEKIEVPVNNGKDTNKIVVEVDESLNVNTVFLLMTYQLPTAFMFQPNMKNDDSTSAPSLLVL